MLVLGDLPHLVLHVVADGEERLLQLPWVYLSQEVGLVLHGVWTRREPFAPVYPLRLRIVARGDEVVVVAPLLVEGTKLDEAVAHHVGVGRESCPHLLHRVARHLVPVFPVAVHHLQPTTVALCHDCRHLHVLLRVAVPFLLLLRSYLDVEAVGVQALAGQLIDHHATIDTARKQYGDALVFNVLHNLFLCSSGYHPLYLCDPLLAGD